MLARHVVLLTPLECAVPTSILISIQNATVNPLESALTSYSQFTENTAALSLLECALTKSSPANRLESALTKNTRGGGWRYVSSLSSKFHIFFKVPYPVTPAF